MKPPRAPVFVQPGATSDGWAYLANKVVPDALASQAAAGRQLAGIAVIALFAAPNVTGHGEWLVAPVKATGLSLSLAGFCEQAGSALLLRSEQLAQEDEG